MEFIRRLLGRLLGPEWRMFFLRRGVGVESCLHKDGFALLGYLQARFRDMASEFWKIGSFALSHYTGGQDRRLR